MNSKINFGEKQIEKVKDEKNGGWLDLPVKHHPKYKASKAKAVELIEKGNYNLDESDFWILMNKGGNNMYYTGLIISHNGCLKINDKLPPELKFKPSCVQIIKDAGEKDKAIQYMNDEQGIFEIGEVSVKNCKNDYPYAMVLKRLMDRVILKNSKIGFHGIFSEAESDDFKEQPEKKEMTDHQKLGNCVDDKEIHQLKQQKKESDADEKRKRAENYFAKTKIEIEGCGSQSEIEAIFERDKKTIKLLQDKYPSLFAMLFECGVKCSVPDSEENSGALQGVVIANLKQILK